MISIWVKQELGTFSLVSVLSDGTQTRSSPKKDQLGSPPKKDNRRDGVVVRASASQSVDMGFIPLVK